MTKNRKNKQVMKENNLEKTLNNIKPHCYFDGKAQYKSYSDGDMYCCVSDNKCPYHQPYKHKEFCNYKGDFKE